jgi:hypothetical protein
VQGSKIFSDAAWKPKKNLKAGETEITGLGVYCQILQDNLKATILLQASTGKTPSPLHAEALGLLLATKIAQLLKVNQITFLTDNLQLARAAASSPSEEQVPWEIRDLIASFKIQSRELQNSIYHIKREINGVAHNCAHQAIRQTQSVPTYSCSNSAHPPGNCPVISSLQNTSLRDIVLYDVNCI